MFLMRKHKNSSKEKVRAQREFFSNYVFNATFRSQKNNVINLAKIKKLDRLKFLGKKRKNNLRARKVDSIHTKLFFTEQENQIEKQPQKKISFRSKNKTNFVTSSNDVFSNSTKTTLSLQQNRLPWILRTNPRSQERRSGWRASQQRYQSMSKPKTNFKSSEKAVDRKTRKAPAPRTSLRTRGKSLGQRPFTPKCSILKRINSRLMPPMKTICQKYFEPIMSQIKSIKDIFFGFKEIGKGSYAIAYSVLDRRTKQEYVLKSLSLDLFTKKSRIKKFIVSR